MTKLTVIKLNEEISGFTRRGGVGISRGCITIESRTDYQLLRTILKDTAPVAVPDSTLKVYGKAVVR